MLFRSPLAVARALSLARLLPFGALLGFALRYAPGDWPSCMQQDVGKGARDGGMELRLLRSVVGDQGCGMH